MNIKPPDETEKIVEDNITSDVVSSEEPIPVMDVSMENKLEFECPPEPQKDLPMPAENTIKPQNEKLEVPNTDKGNVNHT